MIKNNKKHIDAKISKNINNFIILDIAGSNFSSTIEIVNFALKKNQTDYAIILTNASYISLLTNNLLQKNCVKNCYYICDYGAEIYDASSKTRTFFPINDTNKKLMLFHTGIMLSLCIVFSTKTTNYCYCNSTYKFNNFLKEHQITCKRVDNFYSLNNILKETDVLSFTFYDDSNDQIVQKFNIFKKLAESWKFNLSQVTEKYFSITNENVNKLNTIQKLLQNNNFLLINNFYYLALTSFDRQCWNFFNINHLCSTECMVKINDIFMLNPASTKNFNIANLNKVIENIINKKI